MIDVRDHGATGDGSTLDTVAVQRALDEAACASGLVVLGAGTYRCGTLHLPSNVTVSIAPWADQETVTNCTIRSSCSNVKIGTETSGDVRDVAVSNRTMVGRVGDPPADENSGIAIESVDGAVVEGVVVDNLMMHDVAAPIFVRLGNRGRGLDPAVSGTIRGVRISNVVAFG